MNSPFSGKFEAVTSLFKSKKQILEERAAKEKAWAAEPIKSIQDLENFYYEFGDKEWSEDNRLDGNTAPSRKYEDLLSVDELEDDNYWQGVSGHMEDVVAGDDETGALDDWGLNEIMGGGKTQRKIDAKYEELGDYVKPIENENLNIPKEKLRGKYKRAQERLDSKEYLKHGVTETAPANLPVETIEEKVEEKIEQVKPEVKVVPETKEKSVSELDKFKLMKDVVAYTVLVANNPDIEKLRPKRGDTPLAVDQILTEVESLRSQGAKASELGKAFLKQCEAWLFVVRKIEGFKQKELKNNDGTLMSQQQMDALQKEYFDLKVNNPRKFALLNFEVIGDQKVASGEWKKQTFAWHPEMHQERQQWVCKIDRIKYVTSIDPTIIASDDESASFYYTENKAFHIQGGTLQFISIKTPTVTKKVFA